MDYTAWSNEHLTQLKIKHHRHITSVWYSAPSDKPLIVMVHGINGDYAGLVPLAAELTDTYRVAIVELPGHGDSNHIRLSNTVALQQWFEDALESIEKEIGPVDTVCAHSFGCSTVLGKKTVSRKKVILLNPVPTPSGIYASYSQLIMNSAHFWAHIYNWRLFSMLRGMTLTKLRTRDARRRVRWTGLHSHPSFDQIVFQARLVDAILDSTAYRYARDGKVALVVCGMFDTIAFQRDSLDMEAVFGSAKTVFLRGGHLLPIESPQRVANLMMDVMVK